MPFFAQNIFSNLYVKAFQQMIRSDAKDHKEQACESHLSCSALRLASNYHR